MNLLRFLAQYDRLTNSCRLCLLSPEYKEWWIWQARNITYSCIVVIFVVWVFSYNEGLCLYKQKNSEVIRFT